MCGLAHLVSPPHAYGQLIASRTRDRKEAMKIKHGLLATTAATLLALAMTTPAQAAPTQTVNTTSPKPAAEDTYKEARKFLTDYGVAQQTQKALFAKLEAGQKWDSFTSDSVPASTEEYVKDGYNVTEDHYADGSVSVSRIEIPVEPTVSSGGISPMSSPNGCTIGSNGARTNCNVDTWVGLISMGFKANYNVVTNTVSSVWGASWSIGGSCSSSLAYLGRPTSNIGLETVSAQMCGVPYSTAFNLQVRVSGGVATESWW